MPCDILEDAATGEVTIVCSSRRRSLKKCVVCHARVANRLCDGPKPGRKSGTCDRPICSHCSVSVPDEASRFTDTIDFCPECREAAARADANQRQLSLFPPVAAGGIHGNEEA